MKLILLMLTLSFNLSAQFTDDAIRLGELEYMKCCASKVNCDSAAGSNLEHRICLNKQFQIADSILNITYLEALGYLATDSLQQEFEMLQQQWVKDRHALATLRSANYRGHLVGIRYLNCMLLATESRTMVLRGFCYF